MARKKELFVVMLVDELPVKGDNYHLYMLKGGTDEAPTYSMHYFTNGAWVELTYAASTAASAES